MQEHQTTYAMPMLDRLVDITARKNCKTVLSDAVSSAKYKQIIIRDVLNLFNTRSSSSRWREDASELTTVDYGLPDIAGKSPDSVPDLELVARFMARALRAFEPRLQQVRVVPAKLPDTPYAIPLTGRPGNEAHHSANPTIGNSASIDFAGQSTAARRFRAGFSITARMTGNSNTESFSFALGYDSYCSQFAHIQNIQERNTNDAA